MSTNLPDRARVTALPARDIDELLPGELGYAQEGNPWALFGQQDPSIMESVRDVSLDDLHLMTKQDGHARALLNVLMWPMRAASRTYLPKDGGEEEADFIRNMFEQPPHEGGMTTPMPYVLSAHSLAFRDGFSVFEKVAEVVNGKLVLRKLSPRPARTIAFRYDERGGLAGVRQKVYWNGQQRDVNIPAEKLLVYTVGKEESPLEGESLFLPAYYHYDKKHRFYYIAHIAAQVGAVPILIGKLPITSKKLLYEFRRELQDIGLRGAITIPSEWEIDAIEIKSILGDLLAWVEHHDVAMSKSILAHFLDVGTEGKGGLGTATTTSELGDLFVVALEAHLADIASGINSYVIPYFVDANFGSDRFPTFKFEPFSDEQKALLKDTFTTLYSAERPPRPEMMFQLQKGMAEALGLEDIDWDELKQKMEEDEELREEVQRLSRERAKDTLKNPPEPAPGGPGDGGGPGGPGPGTPPPAPPTQLSEDVVDAFGEKLTVGCSVMLAEDPDLLFTVRRIVGDLVQVDSLDPGDDEASLYAPSDLMLI